MKTFGHQQPDVVNQTRSNLFGWRGQFTPGFKALELERLSNCGGFATIKRWYRLSSSNPVEFDGIECFGVGLPQGERLRRLNQIAIRQMQVLTSANVKALPGTAKKSP